MKMTPNARLTGFLFLLPLLAYGLGNSLLESAMAQPGKTASLWWGASLVVVNSVAVTVLGIRLFPVLKSRKRTAVLYLLTRVMEAILLLIGLIMLVSAIATAESEVLIEAARKGHFLLYQLAMLVLGAGSVFFCLAVYHLRRLPGWLAVTGCIGYALLAIGSVAELLGFPIGILLSVPGGLFEITLGIRLLVKGWNASITTA